MKHLKRFNENIDFNEIMETCKEILYPLSDDNIRVDFTITFNKHLKIQLDTEIPLSHKHVESTSKNNLDIKNYKKYLKALNDYLIKNNYKFDDDKPILSYMICIKDDGIKNFKSLENFNQLMECEDWIISTEIYYK